MPKYPNPPPREQPWDRLEPSPKAWKAYQLYREMGSTRSFTKVREALGKPPGYARVIEAWASQYQWTERVQAWDTHLDKQAMAKATEEHTVEVRAMLQRHRTIAEDLVTGLSAVFGELAARVKRGDKQLIEDLRTLPAGSLTILVTKAARALPIAVQLERQARDLPVDGQLLVGEASEGRDSEAEFVIRIDGNDLRVGEKKTEEVEV